MSNLKKSSEEFINSLTKIYGEKIPPFSNVSYREATIEATKESKFLLVYLHSDVHQDTNDFCKNTLCTNEFKKEFEKYNNKLILWGGSILYSDVYITSLSLGCATFPFFALLACVSNGVNVIDKFQGTKYNNKDKINTKYIFERILKSIDRNGIVLTQAKIQQNERQETAKLREEQDREYQKSLEADKKKQEEMEAEIVRKNELLEKQKLEQEEKERKEKEKNDQISNKRDNLVKLLPSEDIISKTKDDSITNIRFQIFNGSKIEKRFFSSCSLKVVRDYMDVYFHEQKINIINYELATNYPRKTWGPNDTDITLQEAGIAPQAVLYIQDLDS